MPWRIFALLLPVGLIAGWCVVTSHEGTRAPSELVRRQDEALAAVDPALIAVGPSSAAADVDLRQLGGRLGLGPGVALAMDGSVPAHWYAMMRYRVFASGYRPKLVLIVAPLVMALDDSPLVGHGVDTLLQHVSEPDDVLAKQVLGQRYPAAVERLLAGRADAQQAAIDPWRCGLVGLLFTAERAPGAGCLAQAEAASVVFSGDQGRTGLVRLLPVVEAADDAGEAAAVDTPMLAHLLDLVRLAGARAVVVRVPLGALLRNYDHFEPAAERAAIELVRAHGGGYLDLRAAVTDPREFDNAFHLNRAGRLRMTAALAEGLVALGALDAAPMKALPLPVVPELSRVGVSPTLPPVVVDGACRGHVDWGLGTLRQLAALGISGVGPLRLAEAGEPLAAGRAGAGTCLGGVVPAAGRTAFAARGAAGGVEVGWDLAPPDDPEDPWWVAPGGGLRVSFAEPPEGPVRLSAAVTALSAAPPPSLVVSSGERTTLAGAPGALEGELRASPSGGWWVELQNPADGAWLVVRQLGLGEADHAVVVAGPPVHDRGVLRADLDCDGAVPLGAPVVHRGAAPWLEVPGLSLDDALLAALPGGVSPIEVRRDGEALVRALAPAPGRYAMRAGRVLLDPADGEGRLEVEHAERVQRRARWLAPGERCRVTVTPQRTPFAHRSVTVAARRAGTGAGGLHLRAKADGDVLVEASPAADAGLVRVRAPAWRLEPYELEVWLDADAPHTLLTTLTVADG